MRLGSANRWQPSLPDRMAEPAIILDSSALIALFRRETGAELVLAALESAAISAVNLAETVAKAVERGASPEEAAGFVRDLALPILSFNEAEAEAAGAILGRHRGRLSLGDCACIATAQAHGLPVLTADRAWPALELGVEIRLIR